jgi:diguanylate cyclase (GGDEF)-like protein
LTHPRSVVIQNSKQKNRVAVETVQLLYVNIYEAVLVNFLAAVGLFAAFETSNALFELSWLGVVVAILSYRLYDGIRGRRIRTLTEKQAKATTVSFAIGIMLSAIAWCVYLIYLLYVKTHLEIAVALVVLSIISSSSIIVISSQRFLAILYPLLVILPFSVLGVISPDPDKQTLGIVGLIFVFVVSIAALKMARFTRSAIDLKHKNVDLLEQLNQSNINLEAKIEQRAEEIYELSNVDSLTKLQNRHAFKKNLDEMLEKANSSPVSLLFIDLDGFKKINDTQGHELGDRLLILVANRLAALMHDNSNVCRWGGDEFLFAIANQDGDQALDFSEALLSALSIPIFIDQKELRIGATVGIAVYPHHGDNAQTLIEHADFAMYHQKNKEVGAVRVFDEAIKSRLQREEFLRQHLVAAEQSGELFVQYQPIVNAVDRRIISFEALMRLKIGDNMISPVEFIPIAENHGLIANLGNWILKKACADAAKWQPVHKAAVSVNVSVIQLQDDDFCEIVERTLQGSGLPSSSLHLEITESVFSQNTQVMRERVRTLQAMGIKVSVDDFGTGYSSLSQLQMLSVDCVKIDRTFVDNIRYGGKTIIEATLQIARALNYSTIAEGIETQEQLDVLHDMGIKQFQGFYFSRPMLFRDLMTFIMPNLKPNDKEPRQ